MIRRTCLLVLLLSCVCYGQISSYPPTGGGTGSGSVTSVNVAGPTWLPCTGGPITSTGTITCAAATGQTANLILGTNGSGNVGLMNLTTAQLPSAVVLNPMTTAGDMIVGGVGGTPARVAAATSSYVWTSNGPGTAPTWQASVALPAAPNNMTSGATTRASATQCVTATIPYTALTAASTVQDITLFQLPANAKLLGLTVVESTTFSTISGITTAAVSIGVSGSPSYYLNPFSLFQSAGNYRDESLFSSASLSAHNVIAEFVVTNASPGNLGNGTTTNLTAGSESINVCYIQPQ